MSDLASLLLKYPIPFTLLNFTTPSNRIWQGCTNCSLVVPEFASWLELSYPMVISTLLCAYGYRLSDRSVCIYPSPLLLIPVFHASMSGSNSFSLNSLRYSFPRKKKPRNVASKGVSARCPYASWIQWTLSLRLRYCVWYNVVLRGKSYVADIISWRGLNIGLNYALNSSTQ